MNVKFSFLLFVWEHFAALQYFFVYRASFNQAIGESFDFDNWKNCEPDV